MNFRDVFDEVAAARPDAVAVEYRGLRTTYRELDTRSAALATALAARGVAPGTLVGLAASASPDFPVALLAVLRAGCAWLPLDPGYPAERLSYMIEDSGISLVIADPATAGRLPARGIEFLDPTGSPATAPATPPAATPAGGNPGVQPRPAIRPEDLAYVIYTSGSTGRPKGVELTHRGLVHLARAQARTFGVAPGDRILQFAPTSFDASVFEVVMALSAGATLVLADRADIPPGPELADALRDLRITLVTLPPSVLATLPVVPLPDLAVLVCAGEALPEQSAARWLPGRRVFNAYGPTETTVWATVAELAPGGGKPRIGRPVPGAHTLVLDERLRPVPPGTPGELAIGGAGVARGYRGRPGLTAERFVPDPAGSGGRVYRTGDLVVQHPDGELEFIGRTDHQAKIRGFRVEPAEIAHHLAEHPEVADAVVTVRETSAGPELVGYAAGPGLNRTGPDADRLRGYLAGRLPAHLVPAAVVVLERMPLTPSGKIDRRRLPAPDRPATAAGDDPSTGPATPTERDLARILGELLGGGPVAQEADFFALGGHSLLAGRFAARVREELGRELSLQAVYETPTVRAMARLLDGGPDPADRPGSRRPAPAVPAIRPTGTADGEAVPLSFPQERVWYLEQLAPGNLAYNAQATIRLHGPLDPRLLRAALTGIVRRNDVFRMAFREVGGVPMQFRQPPVPVRLPLVDLSAVPADERDRRTERIVRETTGHPFDLGAPPLARWVLVRHAADDHTLVHVEHHLVHDGWSFAVFLRELRDGYQVLAEGRTPVDRPDPLSYADFARWQRSWLTGDALAAQLDHWAVELDGAPPALELPTDRPRPAVQSFAGAALRVDLPAGLSRRLRAFSRAGAVTLYTTMLSGFAALLSRHSGQRDLVVGTGAANRRLAEVEELIGMVVNTLPLRFDLTAAATFAELVRQVHATTARAHEWQDVPLDRLVEALQLPRDPTRNPLFQVMFSFHDSHIPDLAFAGLTGTVRELHNGSAKTDINVVVLPRAEQRAGRAVPGTEEHGGGDDTITLIWEYATDLFDAATMRSLVDRYLTLLGHALDAPDRPLDRLDLLTPRERQRELAAATGPRTPFPADRTLPELFAECAARHPDAPALVHGPRTLRYAELDERANRLAHLLRARGVDRDVPVGVLLDRGEEMVTALLAVLKAGGAYVPLDPGYPADRLEAMLRDTGAPLVVTRAALRPLIAGRAPVDFLALDEADLAAAPATAPEPRATPGSLAYVLFTSGSTGRPKGVLVEHRSVLRLVRGADYAEFGPGVRMAQVADVSFDALTYELWGALLNGGCVCIVDRDELLAPGGLEEALRRHRITDMFLTSALFTEVMSHRPGTFGGLSHLIVGGDALHPGRVRALLAQSPARRPARLSNGYGPTETTTFAVCHPVEELPDDAGSVPIGRPIANTTAYVLDERLAPVPPGVPGELYIGGPGVARGYASRPADTAQRFLPDPFAADGSRMYRTGDTVRRRSDGALDFLGRADHQVKIRGYRVEPGELETVLTGHPAVGQAAVVVDDDPRGRRLVAYVAPPPGGALPSAAELRSFLVGTLPPFLLPAAYGLLPALPLTPSGKIDRAALPAVDDAVPPAGGRPAPRDRTERAVTERMADLLGVTGLGVTDDFFALGGNSLLAMRLVAGLGEDFGVRIRLSRFLADPTAARLAAEVRSAPRHHVTDGGPTDEERLLARLDELTDDEVAGLLDDMADNEVER
ncbi:amino acid adenylation domain-containing protein [Kitasatospora sp. NPDC059827]|uniref:amino acid adenylation domain-containing protein n=1 Tax=Kitasatospora sp. NPDC059827 TaxID=3346964 RepID=UPI0036557AF0